MKTIIHLSDTHGKHPLLGDLPKGDIIIHSGDVGMAGTEDEIMDFLNWFMNLPYDFKIFVPGNHDDYLRGAKIEGMDSNCHILDNTGIVIDGTYYYGLPMYPGSSRSKKYLNSINQIPHETDILITHQPPLGILDYAGRTHFGSEALLRRVTEIKPKLHLFGHIHKSYGKYETPDTLFVNGSLMNEAYQLINKPRVIKI